MNQQTLILDLDDTLIHCNKYFHESRNRLVKQIQEWFPFLTKGTILQKLTEIDLKNVEQYGLHSSRYPEALVLTYKYFCLKNSRMVKADEVAKIHQIGQSVFTVEVQPFPNMYEILEELLTDGHSLCLFTGGDVQNQFRKITELGLDSYFGNRVFISEHKNTKALERVLNHLKANKKSTWMIGNSLRTDIRPAIELGINAIHIPSDLEWSYNIVDIEVEPNGTFAELASLLELPEYLREYSFYHKAI